MLQRFSKSLRGLRSVATRGLATNPNFNTRGLVKRETEGFPICVSSHSQLNPLSPEIHREDVFRYFDDCNITREDIAVQYSAGFRPQSWWVRFHSEEDRKKAFRHTRFDPRWGGKRIQMEAKSMTEWNAGTFNHLIGKQLGCAVLVSRLSFDTTTEDLSSFFRSFHLQGNGVTLIQESLQRNFGTQNQFRRAIVKCITQQEAQRATRALHRKYLRTNMVSVRVLQ